jgi:hypothetical protein
MTSKFSALRLSEFAKKAATGAVAGAIALQPIVAKAGTGSIVINSGGGQWHVNTNIIFNTTSSNWGFSEATLVVGTRNDAFDGALSWLVSTAPLVPGTWDTKGYRSPGGVVSNVAAGGGFGPMVTGNPQTMDGLTVQGQLYFLPGKAVARSILKLTNPTGAAITVNVNNNTNRGSDANTRHLATSSGDAVVDATDNWFISDQNSPGLAPDPVLTFAYSLTGNRGAANPFPTNGIDKFFQFYTLTIQPGQTQSLMIFVQMSATLANAQADAVNFNSMARLSVPELQQIVNWTYVAVPTEPTVVPTSSDAALIAMAAMLGYSGMTKIRRRKSRAKPVLALKPPVTKA